MPLLGYDVEKTKLVVNQEEADRVRQIFHLYMELGALLPVVAELNRRGWTTKRWPTKRGTVRGGKEFNKTVLHQLLTNPAYIGKVRYKSEVHAGEHEPIVNEALFNQVQKRLMGNGRDGGSAVRNKHGALLRGLLRCANCDCAMSHSYSSRGSKRYRYYTCTRAQKQGFAACKSPTVPAGEIERFVVEQIRCVGQDPALARETLDQLAKQNQETIQRLVAEERTLVRDLKGFHSDVQKASVDPRSIDRLADLHERIRCAEWRLTEVREELLALESQTVDEADVARALAQFDPVSCRTSGLPLVPWQPCVRFAWMAKPMTPSGSGLSS